MRTTLHQNGEPSSPIDKFVRIAGASAPALQPDELSPPPDGGSCTFELPAGTAVATGPDVNHTLRDEAGSSLPIRIVQVTGGIGGVCVLATFE